jgi:murein DD-endopeptidase MepM/ murein hydrolase activator NlpD
LLTLRGRRGVKKRRFRGDREGRTTSRGTHIRISARLSGLAGLAIVALFGVTPVTGPAYADGGTNGIPEYRRIVFPVVEPVTYSDTFGACREGCTRRHEGQDLIGHRLFHERSAVDGTVVHMVTTGDGTGGNWLEIRDAQGRHYNYGHINNDTPGTDDGANPAQWRFAPGIVPGAHVRAGQFVAYMGDSGDAEFTVPHLHFEIRRPDDTAINAWASLRLSQGLDAGGGQCRFPTLPTPHPDSASGAGYWAATAIGAVYPFGAATSYGGLTGTRLNAPVTGMTARTTGHGYWLLASDGGIFSFGDAPFYGSTGAMRLNKPIVSMAATPTGHGYWLLGSDGGVFSYGDASFHGSTGAMRLNAPIIGMAATTTGRGYWLYASDGGVFSFGDARFYGSTGGDTLAHPVVRVAVTPTGKGYWLVTSDGAVHPFGDGTGYGSLSDLGFCAPKPVVSIAASRTGHGYWLLQNDGHVRTFGDAKPYGDASAHGVATVAFAVMP